MRSDQKFDTLLLTVVAGTVAVNIIYEELLLTDGLTVQFKTRVQNHTLFMIKMAKIDSPIMTKTAKKTIPFGVAHKREYSPGPMDQLPY